MQLVRSTTSRDDAHSIERGARAGEGSGFRRVIRSARPMLAAMPAGPSPIRRVLGWVFVGSLCAAALVAIVALVSDSFDDTDWRLIGTSLSFAVYSALAASGAALRVKEHPVAGPLHLVTVAAAAVAWALLLVLLWAELDDGEALARTWGVATIAALACSHASVVLRGTRTSDTAAISALVLASIALGALDATAGALAAAGAVEIDEKDPLSRLMAVSVVLLLLCTALPVVLRRLRPPVDATPAASWPAPRASTLERLAAEVVAATERIEGLDDRDAVRAECRRLRELARSHGG
jgi:hypothetical protein